MNSDSRNITNGSFTKRADMKIMLNHWLLREYDHARSERCQPLLVNTKNYTK